MPSHSVFPAGRASRGRLAGAALALIGALILGSCAARGQPATNSPAAHPGRGRPLLDEEFHGTQLDTSRWHTCIWWMYELPYCPGVNGQTDVMHRPENVVVRNGMLQLVGRRERLRAGDGHTVDYTAGLIQSGRRGTDLSVPPGFAYRYGYAEARVRVPRGAGFWSGFWLVPADESSPAEVDVMEMRGSDPAENYMTVHWKSPTGESLHQTGIYTGADFSAGWHTFGLDWEPHALVWYVDGVERQRVTAADEIPQSPMILLATLDVGGTFPGQPNGATPFPSSYSISYIRVWQGR